MKTNLLGDDRVLLVKVDHSAAQAADADEFYELARKWWRAAPVQVEPVRRVLAVAANKVLAVYEPHRWEVSSELDTLGRVAFHGVAADDQEQWLGLDVSFLFPQGASNPVRYTTAGALTPARALADSDSSPLDAGEVGPNDALVLLLRINQSWHEAISADDLYDATRHWWVMSPTKAEKVVLVLAVADGVVREAYTPTGWDPCPKPGKEHRIGFEGILSNDRERWIGFDVSAIFPHGSQNPVRYVRAEDLVEQPGDVPPADWRIANVDVHASSPDLAELVDPLMRAFGADLVWAMSRGAQELFHSNTLAALMSEHPRAVGPLASLFVGSASATSWKVWREWKHIDLVAEVADGRGRFVVENKLYSVPYPEQLRLYAGKALPWSEGHGPGGAANTDYYLLSLMDPAFELPHPWQRLSYEDLLRALQELEPVELGADAVLVERYRSLVQRLVELKDAVDPRQDVEGPFAVDEVFGNVHTSFVGPFQRMRFSGLAQMVSEEFGEQLPLVVDLTKGAGSLTYTRTLTDTRAVGWQFQGGQLRMFVLIQDEGLTGKGSRLAAARAEVAEQEYAAFVDFQAVSDVLGARLLPTSLQPGEWRRFAPDFVYRYRKVDPAASSAMLAEALSELTLHVKTWV